MRPPRPRLPPLRVLLPALPAIALAIALAPAAACDETSDPAPRRLHVFAASSLQDVVADLTASFEAEHPGVRVVTNVAGSQQLRVQIEQGARPSIVLSANRDHLDALYDAGLVAAPQRFACNELVLVVGADARLRDLAELPRVERLVVGEPRVPLGAYTEALLGRGGERYGAAWRSGVERAVVSRELNARQVLAKVALGEADAAIVYRSDALAAGDAVRVVPLPPELGVRATYWVSRVPLSDAEAAEVEAEDEAARAWMRALRGPDALARLQARGFAACEEAP